MVNKPFTGLLQVRACEEIQYLGAWAEVLPRTRHVITWVFIPHESASSDFQLSVVKPKPNYSLKPIIKGIDRTMNQSKLAVIACNRR